ncbi:MAG: Abi family protein [Alphaproteobacteria bacterium]|jgi:hypothetical protein|nr:Abi family protein [Alphaproteobacteria bacterium]
MNKLCEWHSPNRVCNYEFYVKDKNNLEQVQRLYLLNQQLTYLIFPVLSNFELLLRNKIYQFLENNKGSNYWYDNILLDSCYTNETKKIIQQQIYEYKEREKSLNKKIINLNNNLTNPKTKYRIANLKSKINNLDKTRIGHLLVSDLSFGTWCHIINNCHLQTDLMNFMNLDKNHKKWISYFFRIKDLRNRCCHHENIIKSLDEFFDVYKSCIALLKTIGGSKYKNYTYFIAVESLNKDKKTKYLDIFNNIIKQIKEIHIENSLED